MGLFGVAPVGAMAGGVFTTLLVAAAIGDIRTRRIPNRLVAILAALGIAFSVWSVPIVPGVLRGIGGFAVGLACWLPFYLLGWLGAGDVKLFAAAGAWLGPMGALEGALIAALLGAGLALAWMLRSQGVRNVLVTLGMAAASPGLLSPSGSTATTRRTMPYGVAIALGALCAGWLPGLLLA